MTTHHHEETHMMRVPPSPDATTPTDRTPEPPRRTLGYDFVVDVDGTVHEGTSAEAKAALMAYLTNPAVTEMRVESEARVAHLPTVEATTDRAAIRDGDEADERGMVSWRYSSHLVSAPPAALDLEAMHETICDNFSGMAEVRQAADALVSEVRSLRAKVAAVEAEVAVWESDRDVCVAWIKDPTMHVDPDHPMRLSGMADILNRHAECIRAALATTGEGKS